MYAIYLSFFPFPLSFIYSHLLIINKVILK